MVRGMAGWGRRTGPPSASLPPPAQRAPRAPAHHAVVPCRRLLHTPSSTCTCSVSFMLAPPGIFVKDTFSPGTALDEGRAPHRGRAARHRPGTAATRRRRRLRECPLRRPRPARPGPLATARFAESPHTLTLSPATTTRAPGAHPPFASFIPCCLGLCDPSPPACTFINSPASAQAPNHHLFSMIPRVPTTVLSVLLSLQHTPQPLPLVELARSYQHPCPLSASVTQPSPDAGPALWLTPAGL